MRLKKKENYYVILPLWKEITLAYFFVIMAGIIPIIYMVTFYDELGIKNLIFSPLFLLFAVWIFCNTKKIKISDDHVIVSTLIFQLCKKILSKNDVKYISLSTDLPGQSGYMLYIHLRNNKQIRGGMMAALFNKKKEKEIMEKISKIIGCTYKIN